MAFLAGRKLRKKDNELTIEGIKTLGKMGDSEVISFLRRYLRIRWWRTRKLQVELRDAAQAAIGEIERRRGHGGSSG